MKKITEQLTAFYKARGLKGAALNSCVRKDIKSLQSYEHFWADENTPITAAIYWDRTKEGMHYWSDRNIAL